MIPVMADPVLLFCTTLKKMHDLRHTKELVKLLSVKGDDELLGACLQSKEYRAAIWAMIG